MHTFRLAARVQLSGERRPNIHGAITPRACQSLPFNRLSTRAVFCRCEAADGVEDIAPATEAAAGVDGNGARKESPGAPAARGATAPTILVWKEPSPARKALTQLYLSFALPWRRFKKGSYLVIKLEGEIADKKQPRFSPMASLPSVTDALRKAAYDPRIRGVLLRVQPLQIGWGKVQEIRKYVEFFRASGKDAVAYVERGGEKEYYLACACAEVVAPPTAQLTLRGLSVQGTFLRGALDKVGVVPEVRRIGKYKSAGDQLLRRDMSEPQREQLSAILDDIFETFLRDVAVARGKSRDEVAAFVDDAEYDMERLRTAGWVDRLAYSDELRDELKERSGGKDKAFVPLSRYKNVSASAFGITGRKSIAVVREAGAITPGGKSQAGQIRADPLIKELERLAERKDVAGIVLRVDSPGGDALASDLMWRAIRRAAGEKPLVATMGDVAASGGYYMAMAAPTVVAQPLTITGSIGVVTGKLNAAELFEKVGYGKEVVSRGRYAELLQDYRPLSEEESGLFDRSAAFAYASFRDKAAESRGKAVDDMETLAQGRVWSGHAAVQNGLVDHLGGVDTAIALVKEKAGIPADEHVTLREVSSERPTIQSLIGGGLSLDARDIVRLLLTDPAFMLSTVGLTVAPLLFQVAGSMGATVLDGVMRDGNGSLTSHGQPQAVLDSVFQALSSGATTAVGGEVGTPQAVMDLRLDVKTSMDAASGLKDILF